MEQKEKKGAHEWNLLPADCMGVSSVNMFKNNINIIPQKGGIHLE